ncbi:hypothetical protein [Frankia sp. CcWB3]
MMLSITYLLLHYVPLTSAKLAGQGVTGSGCRKVVAMASRGVAPGGLLPVADPSCASSSRQIQGAVVRNRLRHLGDVMK